MKNAMRVMGAAVVALTMFFSSNVDLEKNTGSVDLAALQSANAWGICFDWNSDAADKTEWFHVTHRFSAAEVNRIQAEYSQYDLLGKNICMYGGYQLCRAWEDIAVTQREVREGKFGDFTWDMPDGH